MFLVDSALLNNDECQLYGELSHNLRSEKNLAGN